MRLEQLIEAPPLSDEVYSIRQANDISRGVTLPLVETTTYYGPLLSYLLAGFFAIAGHSFYTARLLVAIMGALAPLAVFWLARVALHEDELVPGGRRLLAPLFAAALMLTSGSHIVVNSHVVWPNSLAALLFALMLGSYIRGLRQGGERWLLAAGVFAGLMLQASPHTIPVLPGLLLHYLSNSERRRQLANPRAHPWPYYGTLCFLILYSPLLIYNLQTGGGSVREAEALTQSYAFQWPGGIADYVARLRELLSLFVRVIAGNLSIPVPTFEYYQIGVMMILLAVGVWYSLKHRAASLVWAIASTVLLMPVFNKGYYAGFPFQNRYLSFLLPACYCLVALAAFGVIWPVIAKFISRVRNSGGIMIQSGYYAALALLVILPIFSLKGYYNQLKGSGQSNQKTLQVLEGLDQTQAVVELDPAWERIKVGPGNNLLLTAQIWLELKGKLYIVKWR